jgi:hypothetical protein
MFTYFRFTLLVLALILLLSSFQLSSAAKKKSKDWSKLDFEKLDEDWTDGDSPEELMHEQERLQELLDTHKENQPELVFDPNDPLAARKMVNAAKKQEEGNTMIFVELKKPMKKGKRNMEHLLAKWAALIQTANLEAKFFDVKDGTVLVHILKPWFYHDILRFLADQPETKTMTKDQKPLNIEDIRNQQDEF